MPPTHTLLGPLVALLVGGCVIRAVPVRPTADAFDVEVQLTERTREGRLECGLEGYGARNPIYAFELDEPVDVLSVRTGASEPGRTGIAVRGPDGSLRCSFPADGHEVLGPFAAGRHEVFIVHPSVPWATNIRISTTSRAESVAATEAEEAAASAEAARIDREAAETELAGRIEGYDLVEEGEADADVSEYFEDVDIIPRTRLRARRCYVVAVDLTDYSYENAGLDTYIEFGPRGVSVPMNRLGERGAIFLSSVFCPARAVFVHVTISRLLTNRGRFRGHAHARLLSTGTDAGELHDYEREYADEMDEVDDTICGECRDLQRLCEREREGHCDRVYRDCLDENDYRPSECRGH